MITPPTVDVLHARPILRGKKIVVLHSGGMDSTCLLAYCIAYASEVETVSFFYGQNHSQELSSVKYFQSKWGIKNTQFNLSQAFGPIRQSSGSALLGGDKIPSGHYAQENMVKTIVPNRNMIMSSFAAGYAQSIGFDFIGLAVHSGDHFIYPDCRPEFIRSLGEAISLATEETVKILAPFSYITKEDIVQIGSHFQIPFEMTYSCYEGKPEHCGVCGTCVERIEAFDRTGIPDPTKYENRAAGQKILKDWVPA